MSVHGSGARRPLGGAETRRVTQAGARIGELLALCRAGITGDDVTLHTLRHIALSRMIAGGYDDYTVMEISGHSSTRMLAR